MIPILFGLRITMVSRDSTNHDARLSQHLRYKMSLIWWYILEGLDQAYHALRSPVTSLCRKQDSESRYRWVSRDSTNSTYTGIRFLLITMEGHVGQSNCLTFTDLILSRDVSIIWSPNMTCHTYTYLIYIYIACKYIYISSMCISNHTRWSWTTT